MAVSYELHLRGSGEGGGGRGPRASVVKHPASHEGSSAACSKHRAVNILTRLVNIDVYYTIRPFNQKKRVNLRGAGEGGGGRDPRAAVVKHHVAGGVW